ncbi:MAG: hypothetical protein K5898_10095 [Ruminococcus sp.]|uniref:hypothetical protein n=1 Tax=Ruminococcus sp. TaxID=41978 RepID=UPI0025F6F70D|nr:hypothetical protein [Ruminococcus sp.]MCR4795496.1 hypothetical protein [Ruminococcus sp.]
MKRLFCLSTALVCLCACLVGCGSAKKDSKDKSSDTKTTAEATTSAPAKSDNAFVGKWQCKELEMDGEKSDKLWGADAFTIFQIEINEDNTGSFHSFLFSGFLGSDEPMDITWKKKDDNSIEFTVVEPEEESTTTENGASFEIETETMTLKKDGDMLILDLSDDTSSFNAFLEKVDSFTPIPEDTEMSLDFSTEGDITFDTESAETTAKTE